MEILDFILTERYTSHIKKVFTPHYLFVNQARSFSIVRKLNTGFKLGSSCPHTFNR